MHTVSVRPRKARGLVVGAGLLCAALVGASDGVAQASPVDAFVSEQAFAQWVVVKQTHVDIYWVMAARQSTNGSAEIRVWAAAAHGSCSIQKWRNKNCPPLGARIEDIADDALEFDPALGSARLTFRSEGRLNDVRWTARGDYEPDPFVVAVPPSQGVTADITLAREAKANGRLFGRRLPGGAPLTSSYLQVTTYADVPPPVADGTVYNFE